MIELHTWSHLEYELSILLSFRATFLTVAGKKTQTEIFEFYAATHDNKKQILLGNFFH